jgi:hypothetical protein
VTTDDTVAAIINSSNSQGTILELKGSATGIDEWGIQSAANNQFLLGDFSTGFYSLASRVASTGAGYNEVPSLNVFCWSSAASVTTAACDTGISRTAPNSIAFGDGTQANATAALTAGSIVVNSVGSGTETVGGSSNEVPLTISSTNSAGTVFELQGTASGVHNWGFQSDNFGHWEAGDFTSGFYGFEMQIGSSGAGFLGIDSSAVMGWMPSYVTPSSATPDTGLSRTAADTVACGNGTQGDASCTFKAALYQGPATAPSGSCTTVGWVFSQDGHATFCNGSTWTTKI